MTTMTEGGCKRPVRRRGGTGAAPTRDAMLKAAEELMIEEGYAAVTNRRVAARANLKPALVQYYFPAMDELFLAVYRRAADHSLARQAEALAAKRPLHALWELMSDSGRTGLAIEFMALARHRKTIRAEIARYAERSYALQSEGLGRILARDGPSTLNEVPGGVAVLLAGAARALVMEEGLGIGGGHEQARSIVRHWLATIEPPETLPGD